MANETIDGCPDEVLEAFLIQSRALLIHIGPEADDSDEATSAGIVRGNAILYNYKKNTFQK